MAGGGARKCAGSLQRGGSRKRTLKSLILEEEVTIERERGEGETDGEEEGKGMKFVLRRIYAPIPASSCESPEPVSPSTTRFRITQSRRYATGLTMGPCLSRLCALSYVEYHCMIYYKTDKPRREILLTHRAADLLPINENIHIDGIKYGVIRRVIGRRE